MKSMIKKFEFLEQTSPTEAPEVEIQFKILRTNASLHRKNPFPFIGL